MNDLLKRQRAGFVSRLRRIGFGVSALLVRFLALALKRLGASRINSVAVNSWGEVRDEAYEEPLLIDLHGRSPGNVRIIAFFLAQYHRDPVNDQAWGKGFTEWRNVTKALPLFQGHVQPKLPADLGFYDLTMADAWIQQSRLVSKYGICGFALYHYWFPGSRPLEAAIQALLASPEIPLPFCLCWANESWTRRWDGGNEELILKQSYEGDSPEQLADYLLPFLIDKRYICENGKPVYLIYRADELPTPANFIGRLRQRLSLQGVEICLGRVLSFRANPQDRLSDLFDFAVQFPVHGTYGQNETCFSILPQKKIRDPLMLTATNLLNYRMWSLVQARCYQELLSKSKNGLPIYPAVMPDFDNTARRGNRGGSLFVQVTGHSFHDWIVSVLLAVRRINFVGQRSFSRHPYLFLTSWNEWAEGSVMEPSLQLGYHYLNTLYRACVVADPERQEMINASRIAFAQRHADALVYHLYYPEAVPEVAAILRQLSPTYDVYLTISPLISALHLQELISSCSGGPLLISEYENTGYDIYPFFAQICDQSLGLLNRYRWILKLHAKRSRHRADGHQWSEALHQDLARINPEQIAHEVGLVVPEMSLLRVKDYLGSNTDELKVVLDLLSLSSHDLNTTYFPAGSMYLIRATCLAFYATKLTCLLDLLKGESCYRVDGSYAHALERCMQLMVYRAGFSMRLSSSLL